MWFIIVPLLIRFDNIVETNVCTIVIVIKNTDVTFDIYSYQLLLSLISHLFLVNEILLIISDSSESFEKID